MLFSPRHTLTFLLLLITRSGAQDPFSCSFYEPRSCFSDNDPFLKQTGILEHVADNLLVFVVSTRQYAPNLVSAQCVCNQDPHWHLHNRTLFIIMWNRIHLVSCSLCVRKQECWDLIAHLALSILARSSNTTHMQKLISSKDWIT